MLRFVWLCAAFTSVFTCAADTPATPYPLWDGHESVERYAKRTNLPPTKTLDLGNGVNLELVLIPAGKFIMGTPEPAPVPEGLFHGKIVVGQATLAAGIGVLLILIATVIIRAIRQRHRPQYSLARFMVMTGAASAAVLGAMHWWHSTKALVQAHAEHKAALARYQSSYDWEKPAHQVTLTTPYYMAEFEVTQEQYRQVTGTNPSCFKGANLPVEQASWNDAREFCDKVNLILSRDRGVPSRDREGAVTAPLADARGSAGSVRLPAEAEWEFACRAGTTTTYYSGDAEADLGRAAWHEANSGGRTHPVGQKEPSAWGLYDMHGNVWEWCADRYGSYKPGEGIDPQERSDSQYCVVRGGSWRDRAWDCRSARRHGYDDDYHGDQFGFRVVVELQR